MPQSDWVAGSEFSVSIDGVQYAFESVDIDMIAKEIDRSNTKTTPGYEVTKAGRKKMTWELEGPYKVGETAITLGEEYTWLYKPYAAHVGFEFVGLVLGIKHSNRGSEGPVMRVSLKAQSDFTPVIS